MTKAKGTGKLVEFESGMVVCRVCGEVWNPPTRPDGWFYPDAFQCPSGCKESDLIANQRYQDTGG